MSTLNFGIRIGATDATQGTLRGALSGFTAFAKRLSKPITVPLRISRRGLGLARDVQLGLVPIVRGLDNIIERGAGLEVVRKSFSSLTGKSGRQVDLFARRLVRAASGTITFAKAMQVANRALASGLSFDQLLTAIDFIGKKSITTGKNAEQAIDKVITGLARGSTLFLDDFGILINGVEGVRRSFDQIRGAGAFDQLGPAAQKAETVRQAIVEMQQQLGKIGVSGKEVVFVWASIKNQISDSVDRLVLAATKSDALKASLTGFRDILGGVAGHLEKGGSLTDVIFGKKGNDDKRSGGLAGILKAGLLDAGEAVGRTIGGGFLQAMSSASGVFQGLWEIGKVKLIEAFEVGKGKLLEAWDRVFVDLKSLLAPITALVGKMAGDLFKPIADFSKGLFGAGKRFLSNILPSPPRGGATTQPASAAGTIARAGVKGFITKDVPAAAVHSGARKAGAVAIRETALLGARRLNRIQSTILPKAGLSAGAKGLGFIAKKVSPVTIIADFIYTAGKFTQTLVGFLGALSDLEKAQKLGVEQNERRRRQLEQKAAGRQARGGAGGVPGSLQTALASVVGFGALGQAGGNAKPEGPSRFAKALKQFGRDFPGSDRAADAERRKALLERAEDEFRLTPAKRRALRREIQREQGRIHNIERGGGFARQAALARTGEEVAELRRGGFQVKPSDRRRIFNANLKREIEERSRESRGKIKAADARLDADAGVVSAKKLAERIRKERREGRPAGDEAKKQGEVLEKILQKIDEAKGEAAAAMGAIATAIGGAGPAIRAHAK